MTDDLPFHSLTQLSGMLARGETTSRAIVDACLARIAALDAKLHAFVEVYREDAMRLADAADLERAGGCVARPAARPADRAQGPPGDRRPADDRGIEVVARAHLRSHGDVRRAAHSPPA